MHEPSLRELKSRGQLLKPSIRLGKAGMTEEFLAAFGKVLETNKIVKLRFECLKDQRKELSKRLAEISQSILVHQVGHTAVFYRHS